MRGVRERAAGHQARARDAAPVRTAALAVSQWFDASITVKDDANADRIDWLRALPFVALHASCVAVIWVGVSPIAVAVMAVLYAVRMFAITAFYHRYFAHKAFRTSRAVQFFFAAVAAMSAQRGPLWWVAHHRNHHRFSDREHDPHSPVRRPLWWAHAGWFLTQRAFRTDWDAIPDWADCPELRWLDRFDAAMPALLIGLLYVLGNALEATHPELRTSGAQLVVWGFSLSTVALMHATFAINSLSHRVGARRFATRDESRNNVVLALITFGEGWHNNHHRFPGSARQGLRWWEIDLTWYGLLLLQRMGIVWALREAPESVTPAAGAEA